MLPSGAYRASAAAETVRVRVSQYSGSPTTAAVLSASSAPLRPASRHFLARSAIPGPCHRSRNGRCDHAAAGSQAKAPTAAGGSQAISSAMLILRRKPLLAGSDNYVSALSEPVNRRIITKTGGMCTRLLLSLRGFSRDEIAIDGISRRSRRSRALLCRH